MFSSLSKFSLAKAALFQNTPVYVQFYITARCNLTCEQCNIIYANADVRECNIDDVERIADNFLKMGVAIILLTGGEPFARKDLPEIIRAFESRGIHVRMQTNGFASEEQIIKCIEAGGKDISISLDSLYPLNQDKINGQFKDSWHKALKSIALFTKHLPKKGSFASLGCVLSKSNLDDVKDVIEFGTQISWHTSLVPIHVSNYRHPRGFRTFDQKMKFEKSDFIKIDRLIEDIRKMRKQGYLLYDSDQYLDDIKMFTKGLDTSWRKKNNNVCDSPNLYFAVLPNGHFQPCCDFRLKNSYPTFDRDFPKKYRENDFRNEVHQVTSACDGCMYGSYPEISISMRYMAAKIQRTKTFFTTPPKKDNWPVSYEELLEISENILNAKKN
jgi:MoaA/NifB/PqqE/SkfB family radical SAM enzyme